MADFFTYREQRASKPYVCEVCKKKIAPGTTYEYRFWKDSGDVFYSRYHLDCARAVDDYCRENNYDECDIDAMRQDFIETKCTVCKNAKQCEPNKHSWCDKFKEG